MLNSFFDEFKTQYLAIHPPALESLNRLAIVPSRGVLPKALVPDPDSYPCYMQKQGSTAIIHINGYITYTSYWSGTNVQVAMRDFMAALADKDVKTIVLHVNSPGGVLTGIAEFARLIYSVRGQKRIVGYAQGMCASAALWLYAACEIRVTDVTSLMGSVGVMFQFEDDSEYYENMGVKTYTVVSEQSPKKGLSIASPEGKKAYRQLATEMCNEFISCVALYTGVSAETVQNDFGQGFLLTGDNAVKAGMADEVGTMADVLNGTLSIFETQPKGEAMAKEKETTQPKTEEGTETPKAEEKTETSAAKEGKEKTEQSAAEAASGDKLEQKVNDILDQNTKMLGLVEKVVGQNKELKAENEDLQKEIETLKAENEKLGEEPDEGATPKANGLTDGIERGY